VAKTVQIRDIDDEVYAALVRRAAEVGITVPDLLRREAGRLAARPSIDDWLDRTRRRRASVTRAEIIESLDDHRGPIPDAGR
jgi:antitoxin FitA